MPRPWILLLLLLSAPFGFCQRLDIPKAWRTVEPAALFNDKSFVALPYECRRRVLLEVDPRFKAMPEPKQLDVLWDVEKVAAEGEKRPAINFLIWDLRDRQNCDRIYSNGEEIFIIRYDPLTLGVTFYQDGDHAIAWVYASLSSTTKINVDILPSRLTLATTSPSIALVTPKNPEKIGASTMRKSRIWAGVIGGMSGMARTTTTTHESGTVSGTYSSMRGYGSFDGSYSGTAVTSQPDYQARADGQRTAARIVGRAQDRAAQVSGTALRATTLLPGNKISGLVYFPRDKRAKGAVLRIPVGTIDFEFPFEWAK